MNEALREDGGVDMQEDTGKVIDVENVSTYLGDDHSLQEVVEQMIDKLKKKGKTVKEFETPQIVVLTQDTLVVTALYKALRDKYYLGAERQPSKKEKRAGASAVSEV